jgi:hypothetical protein
MIWAVVIAVVIAWSLGGMFGAVWANSVNMLRSRRRVCLLAVFAGPAAWATMLVAWVDVRLDERRGRGEGGEV